MQISEEMRQASEEAYRLIGEVVLMLADAGLETKRLRIAEIFRAELDIPDKWSSGMTDVMRIVIDKLEILPAREDVGPFN